MSRIKMPLIIHAITMPCKLLGMKQDFASRAYLELTNPEAANVITHAKSRRFLEPFNARECRVKELASELEVDMSSALYRVRQFIQLGLIEEVRKKPRQGRPISYYKSVADGFYIPFNATSYSHS